MAYDTDKLYKQAKKASQNPDVFFIEDIVAMLPCDKTTFYRHFPIESNKYNTLREQLEQNKINTKLDLRAELKNSEKTGDRLALYRLLATPEEHQRLNQSYNYHKFEGAVVTSEKMSADEAKEIMKKLKNEL